MQFETFTNSANSVIILSVVLMQALNNELGSVDWHMSDIVSICEALTPELSDGDKNRAKAAVNDRSLSVDRYSHTSLIRLLLSH